MKLNEIFGLSSKEKYAKKLKNHTRVQDLTKPDPDYDYEEEMKYEAKYLVHDDTITNKNQWMHMSSQVAKTEELRDEINRLRREFGRAIHNEDFLGAAKIFKQFQHTRAGNDAPEKFRYI